MSTVTTIISASPEATIALGEEWARAAQSGWVIALTGDLGAGKTQLVKGIARGLGVSARVHSPTFTLVNEYGGGRLPLYHLDLYRLETRDHIIGAGLEPYLFSPRGVSVVEWAERWFDFDAAAASALRMSGAGCRRVWLQTISETERRISYEDVGT